jgi:hypothetical protein
MYSGENGRKTKVEVQSEIGFTLTREDRDANPGTNWAERNRKRVRSEDYIEEGWTEGVTTRQDVLFGDVDVRQLLPDTDM